MVERQPAAVRTSPPARLWYDVTGLAQHKGGITGIQRVQIGIAERLLRDDPWRDVRFCTFRNGVGFRKVGRSEVAALLGSIGAHSRSWEERHRSRFRFLRKARRSLSKRFMPVCPFAPGDVLLNLGFSTYSSRRGPDAGAIFTASGVRYVGMIYDILTVTHPEWWEPGRIDGHRAWFAFTGRTSDPILCCSAATQRDVERFLAAEAIAPRRFQTVRLADELSPLALASVREAAAPPPRPYVLYVSQLDVRKNHGLLLEVWRRLVEQHGIDRVPDLLCVGRLGYGGEEVLRAIAAAPGGRVHVRHDIDDAELARLYRDCLFTVYPSFAEGWGLPIGESLGHGKYCIASSSSSLPEVGGELLDYHDPTDVARATELIARAAFDPGFRAEREARIRSSYRYRTWHDALQEIARAVGLDPAGSIH